MVQEANWFLWFHSNEKEAKMAESETLSVDTSTENQDDPLTNISDEELYQLVEDTR